MGRSYRKVIDTLRGLRAPRMSLGFGGKVLGLACGCPRLGSSPSSRQDLLQPAEHREGWPGWQGVRRAFLPVSWCLTPRCGSPQPQSPAKGGSLGEGCGWPVRGEDTAFPPGAWLDQLPRPAPDPGGGGLLGERLGVQQPCRGFHQHPGHLRTAPSTVLVLGLLPFLPLSFSLCLPPPFFLPFKILLFIMKNVKHTQT